MTRASERLDRQRVDRAEARSDSCPENSWHKRVERALVSLDAATADDSAGAAWPRYAGDIPPRAAKPRSRQRPSPIAMPDWARTPAPPEARPPRPLAPSAIAVDDDRGGSSERRDARCGAAGDLDPSVARAPAAGRARPPRGIGGRGSSGRSGWRTRRRGTKSSTRSARSCPTRGLAPLFGPGSLGGSATGRDLARRASHRRHRRPSPGRGGAGLGDRFQDRPRALEPCGHSGGPPGADAGLLRGAARDLSRAAKCGGSALHGRPAIPPNSRLEWRAGERPYACQLLILLQEFARHGHQDSYRPELRCRRPWFRRSRSRRFLGGMVRSVPDDRSGIGRDRRRAWRQGHRWPS